MADMRIGTIHARANAHLHTNRYSGGHVTSAHRSHHHVDSFSYSAKMAIDADGGHSRLAHSDPYYQRDTSLHLGGRPLNSDEIPFVVLPPSLARATGAKLGDLVQVHYRGKTHYAIYGDVGPEGKLGEGSIALAKKLGIPKSPNTGGASHGVSYTVLAGTHRKVLAAGRPSDAEIQRLGLEAALAAKQRGAVR